MSDSRGTIAAQPGEIWTIGDDDDGDRGPDAVRRDGKGRRQTRREESIQGALEFDPSFESTGEEQPPAPRGSF